MSPGVLTLIGLKDVVLCLKNQLAENQAGYEELYDYDAALLLMTLQDFCYNDVNVDIPEGQKNGVNAAGVKIENELMMICLPLPERSTYQKYKILSTYAGLMVQNYIDHGAPLKDLTHTYYVSQHKL